MSRRARGAATSPASPPLVPYLALTNSMKGGGLIESRLVIIIIRDAVEDELVA